MCAKIFSSLCSISGYKLQDNDIFARVLLALSSEGYFLGDFLKVSLALPFAFLPKMRVLGDLAKIVVTSSLCTFCAFYSSLCTLSVF